MVFRFLPSREISNNSLTLDRITSSGTPRLFWKVLLVNPKSAFRTMGNVGITSVGMMGKINGWFIHKSVHPISFGVGSVLKKPVVIDNEVKIREILNMTILVDHDVIDGAPMVRFLNDLTNCIETGEEINTNA